MLATDETVADKPLAGDRSAAQPGPRALQPVPIWQGTWRLLRTHAFRLAALYFAVFAVSVLGVLLFVYFMSADFVERQTEATLDAEITGLAEQYAQRGLSGLIQIVAARSAGDRGDGMLYLVTNPEGRPLAGNIADWPAGAGAKARTGSVSFTIAVDNHGRAENHPARGMLIVIPDNYRLLVGRDVSDGATFRDRVKTTLVWSGLLALGVGLVGGSVMSRNMLRRVEHVNRTAERVIAGNLSDRVPLRGTGDEFDQLAANLNSMLDQIERLMTGLREVTDNVAHDLRTPLARLRARLELALLGPPAAGAPADAAQDDAAQDDAARGDAARGDAAQGDAAQGDAIRAAIDEADRLLATFNALLSITEAESGAHRNRAAPLDLSELAGAAAELYEPVAEEGGFGLKVDSQPGVIIRGDRHILSQAVANLLDNALKYGASDSGAAPSEIHLSVRQSGGRACLEVADHGPGIPDADRDAVFDRFVRLEPSRSTPGNGLGLSLVRAAARLHDGTVTLSDNNPGLTVRLEFPALAA